MKIAELLEVKFEPDVQTEPHAGILDSNNSYLGAGVQAIVYLNAAIDNAVVKMIAISGADDPAYQFTRICINNPKNPWLPKIYGKPTQHPRRALTPNELEYIEDQTEYLLPTIASYLKSHPHVLIVNMERLYPLPQDLNQLTDLFRNQFGPAFDVINAIDAPKFPIKIIRSFRDPAIRKQIRLTATDKNLINAMRLLEPLLINPKYEPDLHVNNFMLRSNNQLVIIDPITRFFDED